jgi:hypothetical protein
LLPLVATLGCAATTSSDASSSDGSSGNGVESGGATSGTSDASVHFVDSDLRLAARQVVDLDLEVTPPGEHSLRVSLVGDSRDAYLNVGDLRTGADGRASVQLTAPSSPSLFSVRASLTEGGYAEVRVSTGEGFTTLEVIPVYDVPSPRTVETWTASVATGTLCSNDDIPPPDGDLDATAPADDHPLIEDVPVGVPLTVTVRAGQFAGGCLDVEAGLSEQPNTVTVPVQNRPLQMAAASFHVRLGIDEGDWPVALDGVTEEVVAATLAGAPTDLARVLAVMDTVVESAEPADAAAFREQRAGASWETVGAAALGDQAVDGVRRELRARVADGLGPLVSESAIQARLVASGAAEGQATLELQSVGGAPAEVAGFPSSVSANWTPAADDVVNIGGDLTWSPAKLVAALADVAAGGSQGATARDAAEAFGCSALGDALAAVGTDGLAFSQCDATCVAQYCRQAVREIWESAQSAFAGSATLTFAISGPAAIDDEAVPVGFSGTWVGTGDISSTTSIRFEGTAEGSDAPLP